MNEKTIRKMYVILCLYVMGKIVPKSAMISRKNVPANKSDCTLRSQITDEFISYLQWKGCSKLGEKSTIFIEHPVYV